MEEIIKKLEEKKKRLEEEQHKIDMKIIKIVGVIRVLADYEEEVPIQNTGIIKVVGEKQKEKERIEALNTEQKIKPIKIDPKLLKKKNIKLLEKEERPIKKRKSTTRIRFPEEMEGFVRGILDLKNGEIAYKVNKRFGLEMNQKKISDYIRGVMFSSLDIKSKKVVAKREHIKEKGVPEKRTNKQKKYPDEMAELIKEHMETNSSKQLVNLINKEYNVGITAERLAAYMSYKKIKRVSKLKKWTDEAMQFLRENINNFSNREICKELGMRFDIEIKVANLSHFLSINGIKRDIKEDTDQEIIDFIKKSKTKDAHALRDKIIEKFEKNISMTKIREFIKKDLPGEGVKEEVKRIKEISKLESIEADSIDDMDLD